MLWAIGNDGEAVGKRGGGRKKKHEVWKYFEPIDEGQGRTASQCVVPGGCPARNSIVKGRAHHLMVHLEYHHKQEFNEVTALEKQRKQAEAAMQGWPVVTTDINIAQL